MEITHKQLGLLRTRVGNFKITCCDFPIDPKPSFLG